MKRCYYEILQVDAKASAGEIKTNYRKLALLYHPDKCSQADAKERFVEISQAYNVLSDPNERSWYDNNREKILFNKQDMSKEDIEMYTFGFNVWTYFTTACFKGYEDESPQSFYSVYRGLFEKIKAEEARSYSLRTEAEEEMRHFQGFGDSTTSLERVIRFYEDWESFSTYKTFVWTEEWDTREANNRWMRREMEKENKKQRTTEKKTYLKTVKDLIAFVKKRDPRFKAYLLQAKEQEEAKAAAEIERAKAKLLEKQQQKIVRQKLEEERFKELDEYYKEQQKPQLVEEEQYYEQDEAHGCQVCKKVFKSQNQLRNHVNSKLHKQQVKALEKEVKLPGEVIPQVEEKTEKRKSKKKKKNKNKNSKNQEEENQNSEEDEGKNQENGVNEKDEVNRKKNYNKQINEKDQINEKNQINRKNGGKQVKKEQNQHIQSNKEQSRFLRKEEKQQVQSQSSKKETQSESEEDFSSLLNKKKTNIIKQVIVKKNTKNEMEEEQEMKRKKAIKQKHAKQAQKQAKSQSDDEQPQLNKAKLKKLKKAEREQKPFKCKVCGQGFISKTKLFDHLNKLNHASGK